MFAEAPVCERQGKDSSKGSVTPYYGTIQPDPNFSANRDAAALQKAIETKGRATGPRSIISYGGKGN